MKKIMFILCTVVAAICVGNGLRACKSAITVAHYYDESHKNAVMEIAFQDPRNFFPGYSFVEQGLMPADLFESDNRKSLDASLQDELYIKKVLIDNNKVVGFVIFYKAKEQSLESLKALMEAQKIPFNENQMMMAMPHLKRTDVECGSFAKIWAIAVSKDARGKGYGRVLLQEAVRTIQHLWPTIKQIQLDVNSYNEVARKLYGSEGFVVSAVQPRHLEMMKSVQYEKAL